MTTQYPLLRSLDPYHARVGYLGALTSVATRSIERPETLLARFSDLLFEKVFIDEPRCAVLRAMVPLSRQKDLDGRLLRPVNEDPTALLGAEPSHIEEAVPADWPLLQSSQRKAKPRLVSSKWFYISEFWMLGAGMRSSTGFVPREKVDRTLQLARWTGVLLPTLELSETGYLIQHLLALAEAAMGTAFNPLSPDAHPCLRILYWRVLLESEVLFPWLVAEIVARSADGRRLTTRGPEGLLLAATTRLLASIEDSNDPDDVIPVREVDDFRKAIEAKPSTQENYLRPRLEILVDLGLLGRRDEDEKKGDFPWEATATTRALAEEMRPLLAAGRAIGEAVADYLDRSYFASMARVFALRQSAKVSPNAVLRRIDDAYRAIGREFGFTPGRTLALKACFLAWEEGVTLEVGEVFDAVYRAGEPTSPYSRHLQFSGGSRFDREFLLRVNETLRDVLRSEDARAT